jgi:hypothetical protein
MQVETAPQMQALKWRLASQMLTLTSNFATQIPLQSLAANAGQSRATLWHKCRHNKALQVLAGALCRGARDAIAASSRHRAAKTSENLRFRTLENLSKLAISHAQNVIKSYHFGAVAVLRIAENFAGFILQRCRIAARLLTTNASRNSGANLTQIPLKAGALLWHKCRHNAGAASTCSR